MNKNTARYFNTVEHNFMKLGEVIENLEEKIKNQAEELKRKDEYIKQLKYERDIRIDPYVTGIITTCGEPKEFVEVVRCKDCMYSVTEGYADTAVGCTYWIIGEEIPQGKNEFCSYGERREK